MSADESNIMEEGSDSESKPKKTCLTKPKKTLIKPKKTLKTKQNHCCPNMGGGCSDTMCLIVLFCIAVACVSVVALITGHSDFNFKSELLCVYFLNTTINCPLAFQFNSGKVGDQLPAPLSPKLPTEKNLCDRLIPSLFETFKVRNVDEMLANDINYGLLTTVVFETVQSDSVVKRRLNSCVIRITEKFDATVSCGDEKNNHWVIGEMVECIRPGAYMKLSRCATVKLSCDDT